MRNICNRYVDSFKILFEALTQACSVMVLTKWRPGFRITRVITDWALDGVVRLGEGWVHSFCGWVAVGVQQLIDRDVQECCQL